MREIINKYKILILIVITAVFGGGVSVFVKIALQEVPSISFTFLRFALAFIVLLPFFVKSRMKIDKSIIKVVALSLLATGNVVLFAFGIKYTAASIAQMIYTASPLLTVLLSYLFLRTKSSIAQIMGLVLGFSGTLVIILLPLFSRSVEMADAAWGTFIIVAAMVSYTLYSVISKHFSEKYKPIHLTSIFSLTTLLITGILSIADFYSFPNWWEKLTYTSVFSLIYVGVVGTAFFYLLIQVIIKRASPVLSNLVLYLQPIVTIILSVIFLNEVITLGFIVGSIFCFAGVWMVTRK